MRRLTTILLSLCLILCMTACGKKSGSVTGLDQLQTEDGVFVYPGLAWGMTVEEAADATGWTIPEPQLIYDQKGELVDSVSTLQNISFDEQNWIVQLQFDPEGSLWSVSLAQNGTADELKKTFDSYDVALNDTYGDPTEAQYDTAIEAANGTILDSTVTWEVTDDSGERINVLSLSFRCIEGKDTGSLALAMNYKE